MRVSKTATECTWPESLSLENTKTSEIDGRSGVVSLFVLIFRRRCVKHSEMGACWLTPWQWITIEGNIENLLTPAFSTLGLTFHNLMIWISYPQWGMVWDRKFVSAVPRKRKLWTWPKITCVLWTEWIVVYRQSNRNWWVGWKSYSYICKIHIYTVNTMTSLNMLVLHDM